MVQLLVRDLQGGEQLQQLSGGEPTVSSRCRRRRQPASSSSFLLCCVCQEQSTTYRYEVVYKSSATVGVNATLSAAAANKANEHGLAVLPLPGLVDARGGVSPVIAGGGFFSGPPPLGYSSDDSAIVRRGGEAVRRDNNDNDEEEEELCYYNFPPRHPRHGHLKWALPPPPNSPVAASALTPTYPDYPVHIRTTTLRRVVVSSLNKKNRTTTTRDEGGRVRALERREIEIAEQGGA